MPSSGANVLLEKSRNLRTKCHGLDGDGDARPGNRCKDRYLGPAVVSRRETGVTAGARPIVTISHLFLDHTPIVYNWSSRHNLMHPIRQLLRPLEGGREGARERGMGSNTF